MQYTAHRHNLSKPMQLSICVVVLALSLVSILLGSRLFMASINEYRASSFLTHWEDKRQAPSDLAWHVAEEAMRNASSWYPTQHGAYAEQLGYMWQWRAYGANPAQTTTQDAQQHAIAAFRQATALRPSWPYAWSGLAYAKLVAEEYDDEFNQALQQAAHYGPSRIGINRRLAEIGLISWAKLDAEQRELVLNQASYAARYSPQSRAQLFNVAIQVQRTELLCDYLHDGMKPCAPLPDPGRVLFNPIDLK